MEKYTSNVKHIDPSEYNGVIPEAVNKYIPTKPATSLEQRITWDQRYLIRCGIDYKEYPASKEPIWKVYGNKESKTPTHYYNFREGTWRRKGLLDWTIGSIADLVKDINILRREV